MDRPKTSFSSEMGVSAFCPPQSPQIGRECGQYRLLAASLAGPSHKEAMRGSDDAFAFYGRDDFLVAVTADGAGSATRSRLGARRIAVSIVYALRRLEKCGALAEMIRDPSRMHSVIGRIIGDSRLAILSSHDLAPVPDHLEDEILRQYHSTLTGAVMKAGIGMLFQIGDGLAVALPEPVLSFSEEWYSPEYLLAPERGEYANNTFFYTMQNWKAQLRLAPFENAESILLMTDGVWPFVLGDNNQLDWYFLGPLLDFIIRNPLEVAAEALSSVLSSSEGVKVDDDKTIFVCVRIQAT